jgi:SAM-dependent methyltransferase
LESTRLFLYSPLDGTLLESLILVKVQISLNYYIVFLSLAFGGLFLSLAPQANALEACEFHFADVSLSVFVRNEAQNTYVRQRDLNDYFDFFPGFSNTLVDLRSDQHWIDFGAGEGRAIIEYYFARRGQAQTTAIGFTEPQAFPILLEHFNSQYLSGPFERMDLSTIEPADLMTDLMGVFTYTHYLEHYLKQSIALLKTGGEFYIHSNFSKLEIETSKGLVSIIDLLREVPGLQIEGLVGSLTATGDFDFSKPTVIKIIKTSEVLEASLPRLEFLYELPSNRPPALRRFRLR